MDTVSNTKHQINSPEKVAALVANDVKHSVLVVSVLLNLTVFITWLAFVA